MNRIARRSFVQVAVTGGALLASQTRLTSRAYSANEEVRLGFISCGGRANELMGLFRKIPGTRIAALCDPDRSRLESTHQRFPEAKTFTDLRQLIEDPNLDAVVVATCNHWHCLAAIWAMQAGKDVYVEKPLSHSQWEGEQTIAAARKYGRMCQVGTQQRSDPMQAEIHQFLHEEKGLGAIQSARVNRYGVRQSIGRRETPLPIDPQLDYDLWLGPAQDKPIYREKLQYDWHWDFNTGSGEMGNWGVHVLDDCRNIVFRDSVAIPKRIVGGGGRVVWNDAGESPNVHFVYFDTGSIPVVIGLANITNATNKKETAAHPGPASGYIVYCEGGRLEGQRGRAAAFDRSGKQIKTFKGNGGNGLHQQNFIDAVRSRDRSVLKAEVQIGHDSTSWCNLANIAFQSGSELRWSDARAIELPLWKELIDETQSLLARHSIPSEGRGLKLSSILEIDTKTQRFIGPQGDMANRWMKREYRKRLCCAHHWLKSRFQPGLQHAVR